MTNKKKITRTPRTRQYVEGQLAGCLKDNCAHTCCDDKQVEEWANEFFAFHERIKDHLLAHGVKIKFIKDRVRFTHCTDGKNCKFLKYSLNKDVDPRPIDCKIFPFVVDWDSIDFDKKKVKLYYWDKSCPLVKKKAIPEDFKQEAERIITRDFAVLFHGGRFSVEFVAAPKK